MREKLKTVRAPENIAAVAESVCEAPSTSIHRRPYQLSISEISKIGYFMASRGSHLNEIIFHY